MKISLSKPTHPRGRHVVLLCSTIEDQQIKRIIAEELLQGRRPIRELDRMDRSVKYRFHLTYLDKILLTFPMAEMSEGLHKRQLKIARREIRQMEVPDITVPFINKTPYDFQLIAIGKILAAWAAGYDPRFEDALSAPTFFENDEVGLGKTLVALSALLIEEAFPALIVTTGSGKYSAWERELLRTVETDITYMVLDPWEQTPAERAELIADRPDLTIVNWEALRGSWRVVDGEEVWVPKYPELFNFTYEALVGDEYHRVNNEDSQQGQGWLQLRAKRVLPMSGSPILNRPEEAFTPLHKCDPSRFPNRSTFEGALVLKEKGKKVGYNLRAMADLREYIAATSIRRRKDQVMDQLPSEVYTTLLVDLTPEQRRLYDEIRDAFLLWLDDGTKKSIATVLAQLTRLKQACFSPELYGGSRQSAKLTELRQVVRQLADNGEKAILFSQWSAATRILRREFDDYNPAYVDGSVKGRKRTEQEDRFNENDECLLYVGTIQANQEAITLSAGTYVVFTDKLWSPHANHQAVGRSAAGGLRGLNAATDTVNVIDIQARNTIEQYIDAINEQKQKWFSALYERDGGQIVPRITVDSLREMVMAA